MNGESPARCSVKSTQLCSATVEQKAKSSLDLDFSVEIQTMIMGPHNSSGFLGFKQGVSEKE